MVMLVYKRVHVLIFEYHMILEDHFVALKMIEIHGRPFNSILRPHFLSLKTAA